MLLLDCAPGDLITFEVESFEILPHRMGGTFEWRKTAA